MTKKTFLISLISLIVGLAYFSCDKRLERSTINLPPVANAGHDTVVVLPLDSVALDGSSSNDPDGKITSYAWTKISGPAFFNLVNASAAKTVVEGLTAGTYRFELKVKDNGGLYAKDTLQVTVVSRENTCNIDSRPVVQARLVPLGKLSIGRINNITASANNKILFVGGSSYDRDNTGVPTRRIDVYDINSNSWSTKDLEEFPTFRIDMGIAAVRDKIFIAGGGFWGDDIYTNRVDIYDGSNNKWSVASLSEYRSAAAGVSAGDKVFFAGGLSSDGSEYWSNTVDIYDDATTQWTTAALSERRGYISAVAAGNKIYFAGGERNDGRLVLSDRIDEYDILSNSWSTSSLQEPLVGLAAISAGSKVFFAGGQSIAGVSGNVEIRDISTGTQSFACILPRSGLSAVLKDKKIIFFTGYGGDPRNGSHFEIYDLTTETWYTGVLNKNIQGAAIISVNNIIYVAGGFVNGIGSDQVWKLEF